MSFETAAHVEARAWAVRPAGRAVDVCFAAVPEAARAARLAVVDALTGHVDGRVLADAELVVSELVSNSVRHAGLDAGEWCASASGSATASSGWRSRIPAAPT
jgi:hypothetical protein